MQNNQAVSIKRKEKDVMKLIMSGKFQVNLCDENSTQDFEVLFRGPKDSPYEGVSAPNSRNSPLTFDYARIFKLDTLSSNLLTENLHHSLKSSPFKRPSPAFSLVIPLSTSPSDCSRSRLS